MHLIRFHCQPHPRPPSLLSCRPLQSLRRRPWTSTMRPFCLPGSSRTLCSSLALSFCAARACPQIGALSSPATAGEWFAPQRAVLTAEASPGQGRARVRLTLRLFSVTCPVPTFARPSGGAPLSSGWWRTVWRRRTHASAWETKFSSSTGTPSTVSATKSRAQPSARVAWLCDFRSSSTPRAWSTCCR